MPNQLSKVTQPSASNDSEEVQRLREENATLREELADARANAKAVPNTRPKPVRPSYGLSEGERADLELTGKTVSPFTGETLTAAKEGVERASKKKDAA